MNLFKELEHISQLIPTDFGGGSPINKTYLMAYLILRNNLKTFAEIGVYRGKSLFTSTYAIKHNDGVSYGIDPYDQDVAREYDIEEYLQKQIDQFIDELNYESIYQDVVNLKSELGFENHLELIRKKSSESVEFFQKNSIKIDMLHIDGNHDTKYVLEDVELYLPLLKQNSFIVMDDIDWNSVKPAFEKLKKSATTIFESDVFAILINGKIQQDVVDEYKFELSSIYNIIESVIEKNKIIFNTTNNLENVIREKSSIIKELEQKNIQLKNSEEVIEQKNILVSEIKDQLNQSVNKILQKDILLKNSEEIIGQKDILLKNSEEIIGQKDILVSEIKDQLNQSVNKILQKSILLRNSEEIIEQKEVQLKNSIEIIEQKDILLRNSEEVIEEKDVQLRNSIEVIEEKDVQLRNSIEVIEEKDVQLRNSIEVIEEKDVQLRNSEEIIKEKETIINGMSVEENQIKELNSEISNIMGQFYQVQHLNNRSFFQRFFSSFPSLYILFNRSSGLKNSLINIKGYNAIKKHNLFDEGYYLKNNSDIRYSGADPLLHYMYHGFKEGRKPSSGFDADNYLKANPDVRGSNLNPLVHYALYGIKDNRKTTTLKKISVVVTSYNHQKYIRKCIDSILMQNGNFELEVILGDDSSQDDTREILIEYQKKYSKIINLLPKTENMGVSKNLKRCFEAAEGDFIAICEGDDYWTDPHKLQKQLNFLEKRTDCAMCFNSILMSFEDKKQKNYIFQENLTKDTFKTKELILDNFIGNFSCCMYRNDVIKKLPDTLYDMFTVDWMFNIACSEYGDIGFINEQMTVYRNHDHGSWSSKNSDEKRSELLKLIDIYNKFLDFKYNSEFKEYKRKLIEPNEDSLSKNSGFQDIIILDDIFPHQLSAFRLQEYNSYLEYFDKIKVYCNPTCSPIIKEKKQLETIIKIYENDHPLFKGKVEKFDPNCVLKSKIIYTIFLNNIYSFISIIEKYHIPFAFTLYPGGGFELKDRDSDEKLKRVFSSPCFRKVIVTQKVTYDYLVDNNFCKTEQIEEIFGVVTPLKLLDKDNNDKQYFGRDKSNLDICFVAHKYTEKGVDKGYDVFIEVAHELVKKYDNIYFHVVGGFDENELDITKISEYISFYGPRVSDWFDDFYNDKDIILSPNIPYKMFDGHFDGFPTGCCTEAGLHKVAIFCTDELSMNTSKFKEGEEIVIIPHDTQKIVEIIEKYYNNPEKLQEITEAGYLKLKELYNFENQIKPRIKILEEIINEKLMKEINHDIEVEKTKLKNSENKLETLENQKTKLLSSLTSKYLLKADSLKLNVGCGSVKFNGWVNIDIEPDADLVADVTKGLPISDNIVDYIYNEHFIEHLNFEDGENAVKEFYRVLKPGGVLRVAAPDLDYIIGKYSNDWKNQDWLTWPSYKNIKSKGQMLNISMREWGHEYLYNDEDLGNLLEKVGFQKITKCELNKSQYPDLSNRETRKDSKLIFEAVK